MGILVKRRSCISTVDGLDTWTHHERIRGTGETAQMFFPRPTSSRLYFSELADGGFLCLLLRSKATAYLFPMYRTVAKRLFLGASYGSGRGALTRFRSLRCLSSSVNSQSFANQTSNPNQHQHAPDYSHSTSSNSSTAEEARHRHSQRPRLEYQEEQARVLGKSLPHVVRFQSTAPIVFSIFFL